MHVAVLYFNTSPIYQTPHYAQHNCKIHVHRTTYGNDTLFAVCFAGENINLCWSPDGQTIAVGNKEDLITFIDVRTGKIKFTEQFKLEVNEFAWNKDGTLFFLTTGQGSIIIHR